MKIKDPRQHDERHLDFIRSLPCCVCMNNIETQAAHIRFSDVRVAKVNAGVGAKPHDRWTVPLCNEDHMMQHHGGDERAFWKAVNIDPIFLALALYSVSGDHDRAGVIIANATQKFAA